jgi:hypothetical protein
MALYTNQKTIYCPNVFFLELLAILIEWPLQKRLGPFGGLLIPSASSELAFYKIF